KIFMPNIFDTYAQIVLITFGVHSVIALYGKYLTLILSDVVSILVQVVLTHNKAFKWDSCRVAFLVCGTFWW
ncbi:TPA: hypothetical protein ACGGS5_003520, partial [Vibrio cholerae]